MALKCRKYLYLLLNKNSVKSFLPVFSGSNFQKNLQLVVQYCSSSKSSNPKFREAIKSYLQKAQKYDQFLKEQLAEFDLGKQFLQSMMGKKKGTMTQEEIDEAIEYLFPSRLYVPKARPMMKPPTEIFKTQKEAAFDLTGRPYHFLFYTSKPNFNQCLHDAAAALEKLNSLKLDPDNPPKALSLGTGKWITVNELKMKLNENVFTFEYEKFIEVFEALKNHPFASEAEDLIRTYWTSHTLVHKVGLSKEIVTKDDVKTVTIDRLQRKTSVSKVSVSSPGTGKIRINNMGLDYFNYMNSRQQVSVTRKLSNVICLIQIFSPASSQK